MNKDAVKNFADDWYERGDEERDVYEFWYTLLRDVFDIERPERLLETQKPAGGSRRIDVYIAKTKVLIEQKSFGTDLEKEIIQSDGTKLTPYEQALRYAQALDEPPRWIITCNFSEFRIYKAGREDPTVIKLRDLRYQFPRLKFLIDPNADDTPPEEKISKEALDVIDKIYEAFAENYRRNKITDYEDALNKICTRLVFCLYAGDSHLLDANKFFDYLQSFKADQRLDALQNLFDVLNTPKNQRDNFDEAIKNFPHVNGGLFEEKILLPKFNRFIGNPTDTIGTFNSRKNFSWHEISPPIFGAMFESTFSQKKRQRASGMFYTSVENIHKVIDPLFLDDLRDEFEIAKRKQIKNRAAALLELQEKISTLTFLDPACGSGNFLTETYLSLRRLENEILEALHSLTTLPENPVKVSINQFFGIEINSFAAAVAQTALWIAENQMLQETEGTLGIDLDALPLKNHGRIVCANALRVDWKKVFEKDEPNHFDFIIGNPPFRGHTDRTPEQTEDMHIVFHDLEKHGKLDYVCAWYRKSIDLIFSSNIRCAFLSTDSICQGETARVLWEFLFDKKIHIDFAHRTFKWLSDSDNPAHVHCVVVGFSCAANDKPKKIFDGKKVYVADNINAYLVDAPNIFIKNRGNPPKGFPKMTKGNQPTDGGNLIIKAEDLDYFLNREPSAEKFIRPFIGADEFIDGKKRYCLWLKGVSLDEIKKMPLVIERVEKVREARLKSATASVRCDADKPTLFTQIRQPTTKFLAVPEVSGERQYIPIDFLSPNIIVSNKIYMISNATLYMFGILTSSIHMTWMRTFCGRRGTSYSYSPALYNNFPWPAVDGRRRRMIERSAQEILNVRADFPSWTFAKLYSEETMPDELRLAHKSNDFAVAMAYGFENFLEDEARVTAELMKLYKSLTEG